MTYTYDLLQLRHRRSQDFAASVHSIHSILALNPDDRFLVASLLAI